MNSFVFAPRKPKLRPVALFYWKPEGSAKMVEKRFLSGDERLFAAVGFRHAV
jgi:hypothetical protein